MSGWDVMVGPLSLAVRLTCIAGIVVLGRIAGRLALGPRPMTAPSIEPSAARDTDVVAAYNDALLSGWAAGEGATFLYVASTVGTHVDHVRAVIARHWQR